MDFKQWLKPFSNISAPIGDLANDIYHDAAFPETDDPQIIYDYLKTHNLDSSTLDSVLVFYALDIGKAHIRSVDGAIDWHFGTNPFLDD